VKLICLPHTVSAPGSRTTPQRFNGTTLPYGRRGPIDSPVLLVHGVSRDLVGLRGGSSRFSAPSSVSPSNARLSSTPHEPGEYDNRDVWPKTCTFSRQLSGVGPVHLTGRHQRGDGLPPPHPPNRRRLRPHHHPIEMGLRGCGLEILGAITKGVPAQSAFSRRAPAPRPRNGCSPSATQVVSLGNSRSRPEREPRER